MQIENIEDLWVLKYSILKPLAHATILKKHHLASLACSSLDLSIDPFEMSAALKKQFRCVIHNLNIECPVFARQEHGDTIQIITEENFNQPFACDGFITNLKNITLCIKHADCQAALFYDPKKGVIANIHCGWRGHIINIYRKTIQLMKTHFHCNVKDICVAISPSLGPKHAEFRSYKLEWPKTFWKYKDKNNCFLLWDIARDQLLDEGLLAKNIEISEVCTAENTGFFHSYRAEKTPCRNLSYISL